MLREIYEQPLALMRTLNEHVRNDVIFEGELFGLHQSLLRQDKIVIVASGSSRHAGLAAEIMIEDLAGIPVDVEYSSEYCYRSTHVGPGPLVIAISQSGETADTLSAHREALSAGAATIAITNVIDSTIAREATSRLFTFAGPESAIPATKSFTAQLMILYLFALYLAHSRGAMTAEVVRTHLARLQRLPDSIEDSLSMWDKQAAECAGRYYQAAGFLYAGRAVHYAIAREGALKLKEVSYANAEGYPTGELLHGPQALVTERFPVVALATCDHDDPDSVLRLRKTIAVLEKVKTNGARLLVIATEGDRAEFAFADHIIEVPPARELLLPILEVIPLQLFAYYVALMNGHDVDRPRNLAKAVLE